MCPSYDLPIYSDNSRNGNFIVMCGIVAALPFRQSGFLVSEAYITKARDTLVHRGPDGASTWPSPDQRVGPEYYLTLQFGGAV